MQSILSTVQQLGGRRDRWAAYLPQVMLTYNTRPHSALSSGGIAVSPFMALFNRQPASLFSDKPLSTAFEASMSAGLAVGVKARLNHHLNEHTANRASREALSDANDDAASAADSPLELSQHTGISPESPVLTSTSSAATGAQADASFSSAPHEEPSSPGATAPVLVTMSSLATAAQQGSSVGASALGSLGVYGSSDEDIGFDDGDREEFPQPTVQAFPTAMLHARAGKDLLQGRVQRRFQRLSSDEAERLKAKLVVDIPFPRELKGRSGDQVGVRAVIWKPDPQKVGYWWVVTKYGVLNRALRFDEVSFCKQSLEDLPILENALAEADTLPHHTLKTISELVHGGRKRKAKAATACRCGVRGKETGCWAAALRDGGLHNNSTCPCRLANRPCTSSCHPNVSKKKQHGCCNKDTQAFINSSNLDLNSASNLPASQATDASFVTPSASPRAQAPNKHALSPQGSSSQSTPARIGRERKARRTSDGPASLASTMQSPAPRVKPTRTAAAKRSELPHPCAVLLRYARARYHGLRRDWSLHRTPSKPSGSSTHAAHAGVGSSPAAAPSANSRFAPPHACTCAPVPRAHTHTHTLRGASGSGMSFAAKVRQRLAVCLPCLLTTSCTPASACFGSPTSNAQTGPSKPDSTTRRLATR